MLNKENRSKFLISAKTMRWLAVFALALAACTPDGKGANVDLGAGNRKAPDSTPLNSGTPFLEPVENRTTVATATATEAPINFFPPAPQLVPTGLPEQPKK